jgi:RNA recognition motif-containing protein
VFPVLRESESRKIENYFIKSGCFANFLSDDVQQGIIEEELASLLMECGIIVNCKVFATNGKKQALVQFETEEEATEALVCKHAILLFGSLIHISFLQLQNI